MDNEADEIVRETITWIGIITLLLSIVCILIIYVYLIFTDAEFAKHSDSVWTLIELIKTGWIFFVSAIIGAVFWFVGD